MVFLLTSCALKWKRNEGEVEKKIADAAAMEKEKNSKEIDPKNSPKKDKKESN